MINKPLNIWLYVLLSIPPFICIYPLRKLKKIRKMFVVNTSILVLSIFMSIAITKLGYDPNLSKLAIFATNPIAIVTQCILVYNWAKKHNQDISPNIMT